MTATTTVSMPQYVLAPDDEYRTAQPSGQWSNFTDLDRWATPGGASAVQYCLDDEDVALARRRTAAWQAGMAADEVGGPALLDVIVDETEAVDLTVPGALVAAGLPANYPTNAGRPSVRAACRQAGDAAIAAGAALVSVRPSEAQVRTRRETLAVLPRVSITVVRRRRWGQWG